MPVGPAVLVPVPVMNCPSEEIAFAVSSDMKPVSGTPAWVRSADSEYRPACWPTLDQRNASDTVCSVCPTGVWYVAVPTTMEPSPLIPSEVEVARLAYLLLPEFGLLGSTRSFWLNAPLASRKPSPTMPPAPVQRQAWLWLASIVQLVNVHVLYSNPAITLPSELTAVACV